MSDIKYEDILALREEVLNWKSSESEDLIKAKLREQFNRMTQMEMKDLPSHISKLVSDNFEDLLYYDA